MERPKRAAAVRARARAAEETVDDAYDSDAAADRAPCQDESDGEAAAPSRKRAAQKVQMSEQAALAALVARLDRSSLEQLLLESLTTGLPVLRKAMDACLPESARSLGPPPPVTVREERGLVSDGPFAMLGTDLSLEVLSRLSLHQKLVCFAVCRGWRSLRGNPQLWPSLDFVPDEKAAWLSPEPLLRWLPPQIAELHLDTSNHLPADSLIKVVRHFRALTRLDLAVQNAKAGVKLLTAVAASHAASLTHLAVKEISSGDNTTVALLDLLGRCPRLQCWAAPSRPTAEG
jgi:hypothetical protein